MAEYITVFSDWLKGKYAQILLTLLMVLDLVGLILLIIAIIVDLSGKGGNIFLPGMGLIVEFRLLVVLLFLIEAALVGITLLLWRYSNSSVKLS